MADERWHVIGGSDYGDARIDIAGIRFQVHASVPVGGGNLVWFADCLFDKENASLGDAIFGQILAAGPHSSRLNGVKWIELCLWIRGYRQEGRLWLAPSS